MAISRMLTVCCHPDNGPTPLVDEVARLEPEIEIMMACWRDAQGASEASAGDLSDNLSIASTCSEFFSLIHQSWWESSSVDYAEIGFLPRTLAIRADNERAWNTCFCLCRRRLRVMSPLPNGVQSHVLERHTKRVQANYNALRDWADVLILRPETAEDFPSPPPCPQVTRRA